EHRRLEQEAPHLLGKAGEHLRAQVVDDVAVVARKGLDELVRACPAADGKRREVETGRPSLRELTQPDDVRTIEPEPMQVVQKEVGLLLGEAKLLRVDLSQFATGAKASERKRRLGTAREHELDGPRKVLEKERKTVVDLRVPDEVIVVQHEHDLVWQRRELVAERREDVVDDADPRSSQHRQRKLAGTRINGAKRMD